MGFPTALLVVVLDNIPKAMCEIKLNSDKGSFVVYEVTQVVPVRSIFCALEIFLGNVAFSSSVERDSCLEDVFWF